MPPSDQLHRFTFDQTPVRGELVQLSTSLKEVFERHEYPLPVRQLLGEFMSAAALLSATLKFEGSLILQVAGDGPVSMLMAECRNQQFLRAIASYKETINPEPPLFGEGKLAITIEPDKGQRYQGIVLLEDNNLSSVLEDYFFQSEQIPTRIWLATDGEKAAGLMLQALPDSAHESSLSTHSDDWERIEILSDTVTKEELLSLEPETIMHRLYHQEQARLYPAMSLEFHCSCSRERSANSLLSIGEAETRGALAASDNEIQVDCQFCNARYSFTEQQVNTLFSTQVH